MEPLPLKVDLLGRVRNMRLASSNALFALYEAVVNSIHAILDGPQPCKGTISIEVLRDNSQAGMHGSLGPVMGYCIRDNGAGFNEKNYEAFSYSDSTTKAKYGGKGVGRMLWLKVFQNAHIASVFERDSHLYKREFTFSVDGLRGAPVSETTEPRGTTVTISSPVERYRQALQHEPEMLAVSIIEHCLEYFIAENAPQIQLRDDESAFLCDLGQLFREDLKSEIKRDDYSIGSAQFRITHLLLRGRKNSRHALHFCADSRKVRDEPITRRLPGLTGGLRLPEAPDDLAYHGYVSGDVLNDLVDAERASFDFEGLLSSQFGEWRDGDLTFNALVDESLIRVKDFLAPILAPIAEANQQRIRARIEDGYPQYRYLLKHRAEEVSSIQPDVEGGDLDLALYKIEQKMDAESRELLSRELTAASNPDEPADERKAKLDALLEQLNDAGTAKLARHVAYRRAVLGFLEDQIGLQQNGKYTLEEAIHSAVCPTRTSSDDIPSAQMNLWLLDDRLYFHYYLASDMPFKEMKDTVVQDSEDRPDLAIFHRPMAFSDSLDEIGSVVLVEFKRPARDDFRVDDSGKNPVSQILRYVATLKAGDGRRAKGQAIHVRDNTPFYAYIVADFTKTLREIAMREDFTPTPDGDGFFRFFKNYNCYIEMISFQKMIRDAKRRNQAFFDKLNIPIHS